MSDIVPPLIATTDERLLDDATRWCAAVGTVAEVARDVPGVRRTWRHAPFVLVGDDVAEQLAHADLPRRDHVVLVARDPGQWWQVGVALGVVGVIAPLDEDRVLELLAAALDGRGEACLVSVVGGSGGVGASTVAAALALTGDRRGLRSLLVDADPLGGGLDLVLGAERAPGLHWSDFEGTRGRVGAGSLTDVLPVHAGVASLTWGRDERRSPPQAVASVLTAALRGFDLVVADVPRHLDATGVDIVGRSVLTVLVVGEDICSIGAARHVLARIQESAPSVAVVSVSRRGGVGPAATSDGVGLPVLARHRFDRAVRAAVDRGHGPGRSRSARRTSGIVLDALGLDRS